MVIFGQIPTNSQPQYCPYLIGVTCCPFGDSRLDSYGVTFCLKKKISR